MKLATKIATKMMAAAAKASNPATAAAAVADVTDNFGYTTFISNEILRDQRDTMEYMIYSEMLATGNPWPEMFNIYNCCGDLYDAGKAAWVESKMPEAKEALSTCTGVTEDEVWDDYERFTELDYDAYMNAQYFKAVELADKDPIPVTSGFSANFEKDPTLRASWNFGQAVIARSLVSLRRSGVTGGTDYPRQKTELMKKSTMDGSPITEWNTRRLVLVVNEDEIKEIVEFMDTQIIVTPDTYRVHSEADGCRDAHKELLDHVVNIVKEGAALLDGKYAKCIPIMTEKKLPRKMSIAMDGGIHYQCMNGGQDVKCWEPPKWWCCEGCK